MKISNIVIGRKMKETIFMVFKRMSFVLSNVKPAKKKQVEL